MKRIALLITLLAGILTAQELNPTQQAQDVKESQSTPLYKVNVVARTTKALNYGHRSQPTKVDFDGTILLPDSKGEAWVESKKGAVEVRAKFKNLEPPHRFGRQYLTYVLWAITPQGRATNLGEVLTNGDNKGKLETATEMQSFALIVTAEPYYSVTQPSDVVVMENIVRPDTAAQVQPVDAKYELLQRGEYDFDIVAAEQRQYNPQPKVSQKEYESLLALYEARNAVQFAIANGAAQYAGETLQRAENGLTRAEEQFARSPKSTLVVTMAREAAQTAEDARLITMRKKQAEQARESAYNTAGQPAL